MEAEKRTAQVFARVTPDEKALIEKVAQMAFQKPGAWLRQLALTEAQRLVSANGRGRKASG
jgi:uncharacterized protein (DUF1778 family)